MLRKHPQLGILIDTFLSKTTLLIQNLNEKYEVENCGLLQAIKCFRCFVKYMIFIGIKLVSLYRRRFFSFLFRELKLKIKLLAQQLFFFMLFYLCFYRSADECYQVRFPLKITRQVIEFILVMCM